MSWYAMERGWMDSPVFSDDPYTDRESWEWLISEASYDGKKVFSVNGKPMVLPIGFLSFSYSFMAKAWKWDKTKVFRTLLRYKEWGMIETNMKHRQVIISICNYSKYQPGKLENETILAPNMKLEKDLICNKPKEGKNKERKKEEDIGDLDLAVLEFNTLADEIGLSKVQRMTDSRKKSLMCRLDECGGIEGWRVALSIVRESPFLRGDNDRGWKADFDFMVKQSSFVKIMEGKYNAKKRTQSDRNVESVIEWMDGR